MSILIHKPQNVKIPTDVFEKCFNFLDDTVVGFSYCDNKQIFYKKKFKSLKTFLEAFRPVENNSCFISFSESSLIEKSVCGPFKLNDEYCVIHTGNISDQNKLPNPDYSQSYNLVNFLKQIWDNGLHFQEEYLNWLLEEALNSSNIMAIMRNDGEVQFFNKNKGFNIHSSWFSQNPCAYKPNGYGAYGGQTNTSNHGNFYNSPTKPTSLGKPEKCSSCLQPSHFNGLRKMGSIKVCTPCFIKLEDAEKNRQQNRVIEGFNQYNKERETSKVRKADNSFLSEVTKEDPEYIDIFDFI